MIRRRAMLGLGVLSLTLIAADKESKVYNAPGGAAASGFGSPENCFESLERATLHMVLQEPFEAAQVLYASTPLCNVLPEMWASLALTDVVLREPARARETLKVLALRPETERWARILGAALDGGAGDLKGARRTLEAMAKEAPDDERVLLSLAVIESIRESARGRRAIVDLVKKGFAPLGREWRILPVEDVAMDIFLEAGRRLGLPAHEVAGKHARMVGSLADRLDIDHTRALRERALELLDVALAGTPNDPRNWLAKRDLVARIEGDPEAVCEAMGKAVTRTHEVVRCRARTAYELRQVDRMCTEWGALGRYRPQDIEARIGQVVCRWWTEGVYPLPAAPGEMQMDAPGSPLSILRAHALLAAGDTKESVNWLRIRAKRASGDLVLLQALAVALRRSGDVANFEALGGFIARRSNSDRESYIFRAIESRRRWAYRAGLRLLAEGKTDEATEAMGEGAVEHSPDLLTQFILVKLALARGDKALVERHALALQQGLRRANLAFFGGLTKEWKKGRKELKKDFAKTPVGSVIAGRDGAAPVPESERAPDPPVRDAVSELLGLTERRIIRSPGGAPPGMRDVPPGMKDMPAGMASQMAEYKKSMGQDQQNMPPLAGFGALPPGAAGGGGARTALPPGIEMPKRSTPAERKRAKRKEKRIEFDMKIDREGGEPRR